MALAYQAARQQQALTGIPSPVLADGGSGSGSSLSVRILNLWIANGAATLGIGWGLLAGGVTLTMLNAYLLQPNLLQSFNDIRYFVVGSSAVSNNALHVLCASTSSGARASFMWNNLNDNILT